MAGRGGAAPARKGSRFEARVVAHQVSVGRVAFRVRQGQGGVVDVLAVEHCQDGQCTVNGQRVAHVYLIQAKVTGKLPTTEREALIAEADKVGGIPLLAWPGNGTVRYEQLGQVAVGRGRG